jgi:polyisoprenoid-binding protein YceI
LTSFVEDFTFQPSTKESMNMTRTTISLVSLLFVSACLLGCAPDPSKDAPAATIHEENAPAKPEAKVEAQPKAEKPAAPVEVEKVTTAKEPSPTQAGHVSLGGSVSFLGSKVTDAHECLFRTWSGTAIQGEKGSGWALNIEIDVKSVFCDAKERSEWSAKLDKHLRSEDFFDAPNHPKATFESTEVRAEAEGENTHVIKGNLTLRGKTKLVSFPATVQITEQRVTGKAKFTINRKDFGIVYPGKADDLIRDGVVLKLQFSGSRV